MKKVRVMPTRKLYEAAKDAERRGHWLELRNGKVFEVIPKRKPKNWNPGPTGPAAA
jgi:hypothetical protein